MFGLACGLLVDNKYNLAFIPELYFQVHNDIKARIPLQNVMIAKKFRTYKMEFPGTPATEFPENL